MADNNNDDRRRRHLRRALKQAAQAAPGGRRSNEGPAEGPGSRTRSRSASVTDDQSRSASVADEPAPAGEPACFQVLENASGVAAEVAAAADAASLAQLGASSMRARAAALGASAQLARRRHGVALPEIAWTTDVARDGLAQRRVALATGAPAPDETPLELLRFLEARDAAEQRKGKIFAAFSARHAVFVDGRGAAFACGRAEDGRSLITGESTTIEPKRLEMSDIGPKWQVEKQLDEAVKAEHKKTHIDYSILQPRKKGSGWVPEAHRGGGGGHSASEFDHGSGATSRPLSPTGGAAKATPRAVNPHPVGTALSWWSRVDHAAASLTKVVAR